jgi:hypothetical protein
LVNVQPLESVAFSFSWHPGATGWQVRRPWQDFGLDNNAFRNDVLRIEGGIKGVHQAFLLDYAPGKNSGASHYDNRVSQGANEI